ncbi:MAG: FoF1-type synthase, rane subunit b or b [Mycobacterium sp.]|nr:FoF1-type synthase, rane subunit b or b [Mycobacterium sp.]
MTVRNLGDWSPLGLHADPIHTDLDVVEAARSRYQGVADFLGIAIARLQEIVDTNSEGLAGQWVKGLQTDAGSLRDSLTKAKGRYDGVAGQIRKYQPELATGVQETEAALQDAETAADTMKKAQAKPDPQKSTDGTLSSEEQLKADDKNKATAAAEDAATAAKARLNRAMDALNVAGKSFGDAVSERNYQDGLTDSYTDKMDAVMQKISQAFAIIGMVLGVLAILIPGVDLLVIGAVAAGAVALVADSVLYHDKQGSILDVVMGALGLGMAGLGAVFSAMGKEIAAVAKGAAGLGGRARPVSGLGGSDIEMVPMRPTVPNEPVPPTRPAPEPPAQPHPPAPTRPAPEPPTSTEPAPPVPNFSRPFGPNNSLPPTRPAPEPPTLAEPAPPVPHTPESPLPPVGDTTGGPGFWQNVGSKIPPETRELWGPLVSDLAAFKGGPTSALWQPLFSDLGTFGKNLASITAGLKPAQDLAAVVEAAGLKKISSLWYVWGGVNGTFTMGNLIYTGGRYPKNEWIPPVNLPGVAAS